MLKIFWLGHLNKKINFKFLNFNKILNYSAIFLFDIIKEKSVLIFFHSETLKHKFFLINNSELLY